MEDWKEYKLGDICNISSSKRIFAEEYQSFGIPFYRGKEIIEKHNKSNVSSQLFISQERFDEIKRKFSVPQLNDILLTSVGTLGVPWLVNEENFYFKDGNLTWLRTNAQVLDPTFLYYWLESHYAKNQIEAKCIGSTQKALTIDTLSKFEINIPLLPTQQKIAQILSSLDDKIELNNKINANLEQQAQALFKSWFVDFEPFGGKMPAEWKVGKLSEIADYSNDKISISELNNDTYYSTENMLPNKAGVEVASTIPNVIQTTRCFPGETIISNIRPYFKKIYYCTEKKAGCSTDVLCFKPITEKNSEYLYQILYSDKFFDYMVLGSKGTKMPRGDKQQIMNYGIVIPDNEYLLKFKNFAKPILEQTDYNRKENKRLANLRDTLLPKLMNGEIKYLTR